MGASLNSGGGGGGRRGRAPKHRAMSEINVTPMVDVMLVLLIIFMVAAPLLTETVPIDLPQGKGKPIEAQKKELLKVSITGDDKIFFGQEDKIPLAPDQLAAKLKAVFEARGSDKDDQIYVSGDRQAHYGAVMDVLQSAQAAGFQHHRLVVSPKVGG